MGGRGIVGQECARLDADVGVAGRGSEMTGSVGVGRICNEHEAWRGGRKAGEGKGKWRKEMEGGR